MQGLTETPTELVLDLDVFIQKQEKYVPLLWIEGILIFWLMGLGFVLIGVAVWIKKQTPRTSFMIASKNAARIARRKRKPIRYVNVPPEFLMHAPPSIKPTRQQSYPAQSSPMNSQPAPLGFGVTFCRSCGSQLEPHQPFCSNCGDPR